MWERLKKRAHQFSAKRYEPLLTDHRVDLMSMSLWLLLGLWGVLSTVATVTVLKDVSQYYPAFWGTAIGLAGLTAFVGAINTFSQPPLALLNRIKWKRVEMIAVSVLLGLIVVYPILMFINMFDGKDTPRPDLFFLSLTYLVVPIWRVGHLASRIAQLRAVINRG